MGREECRRPQIVAPRGRFAALLEMAKAAIMLSTSLKILSGFFR
ncbi:hypothetical protein ODS41_11595 [Pyrobaculum sp. 3827-6]|nr:hypothetical protein [Pyrobaculum sp. 3827-6]MCU7788555.1 hypothetical protein [Pyrobaculum sp. 3827-6]